MGFFFTERSVTGTQSWTHAAIFVTTNTVQTKPHCLLEFMPKKKTPESFASLWALLWTVLFISNHRNNKAYFTDGSLKPLVIDRTIWSITSIQQLCKWDNWGYTSGLNLPLVTAKDKKETNVGVNSKICLVIILATCCNLFCECTGEEMNFHRSFYSLINLSAAEWSVRLEISFQNVLSQIG